MNDAEILAKAERGEGLTEEEIKRYQELVKPVHHVYGKYGTLALDYLKNHAQAKMETIENLPEYLHGIDRQAEEMDEVLREKLSKCEQYKRTGDYLTDVQRLTAMQQVIDEEIRNELVYVG